MKALRHLSLLLVLVCSTLLIKAQCGIDAGFYQDLNPNQVPWFHDTTVVDNGWQISNHYWSFGDGGTSTLTNPTHVFPHPGTYTVCHYVQASDNNGNNCIDTVCKSMQFYCTGVVQATISASVQNNVVVFTGTGSSNYPPLTYYWQFPGGTPSTSTTAITTVSYTTTGAHQVYLTVTDSNGCTKTVTQSVTTTGNACGSIDANFTYTLAGQAGTTVYFNSTSTGTTTNSLYQWKIDGVFVTNPNPNTGYVATNMGTFSLHEVCLYVYANSNTLCDSVCQTVQVTGCNVNINAGFQYTTNSNVVSFSGSYAVFGQQTLWDFGDGTTSTDTAHALNHTYPANPNTVTYNVCHFLTVNNTLCADTFCQAVVVPGTNTPCSMPANFTYTLNGATLSVAAANNYPSGTWYQWSLDGQYTTTAPTYLAYTYNNLTAGVHRVCLYIKGNQGTVMCDSICQQITVPAICGNVSFTSNNAYPTVLTATSTGTGTQTYRWQISTMNGQATVWGNGNPLTFTAFGAGTYHACVYLYNSNQQLCDSSCHSITIIPAPTCITLQPNGNAGKDALLSTTSPNSNDGAATSFLSAAWTAGGTPLEDRSLLQFDLTSIPAGSTITSARLSLFADSISTAGYPNQPTFGSNNASYLKKVTSAWTESGVTWNNQPTTTTSGQITLAQSTSVLQNYINIDVAAFVQQWVNTPAQNYGVMLDMITTNHYNSMIFGSSDHLNAAKRPKLEICYTPPCATVATIVDSGLVNGGPLHKLIAVATGGTGTYTYLWNIGATTSNITVQPGGTYCVTITDNSGCSDTACYTIPGTCGTVAFTSSQTSGHLVLTATSTTTGNNYVWAIRDMNGNGVQTGSGNPFTTNTLPNGTYSVCVYMYTSNQTLCDTACQNIAVTNVNPCTGLTAQWTNTYNNNNSVSFFSANQLNGANYHWDFGDGHDSNLANPTHSYLNNGLYEVCLIVNLTGSICADTFCHSIQANTVNNCTAAASITGTVNPNGVYELVAHYSGSSIMYAWSTGATTAAIVTTAPGTYCVTVTNNTNCTATACYTVANNCGTASFTGTISNNSIHAVSTSTGTGQIFYYWNLYSSSNNLLQTQSGQSGTFNTQTLPAGNYRICLFLYNNNSTSFCDSACENYTVTDSNACANLSAIWTPSYVNGNGVHFIGVGTPSGTMHQWTFGDGNSSTQASPTHYYTAAGIYNVCHIVSIPGSICADTFCHSIQANAGNPCSGFAVNINHTINNNGVHRLQAVASGGGSPFTYLWSNGATTQVIETTSPNVYCVTVYNASQCSATDCDTVATNTPACHAQYSYAYVNCNTIQFANASTGGYTNQVWHFGDGTSSSAANPVHSFPAGTWTVQLTVYSTGTNCQSSYYTVITVQPCGINDTICGVVFNDVNGNGVQDNGEQGLSGGTIHAGNYSAQVTANGQYYLILPTGTYTVYYCAPTGYSFTIPVGTQNPNSNTTNCASYTIATSGGHHCGYNFGVQNNTVNICGTVYLDANNNQQRDYSETGIANVHVTLVANGQTYHAYTSQNGNYCVTVPAGTYTITATTNIGGVVTPGTITLATTNGGSYYNNNFGVYQQPGACNLGITITPHTTVTAGFAAWYDVRVCNLGASTSSGTVSLFYDPTLIYSHSSPAQTAVNTSTHTVSWALNNLAPGACASYFVTLNAATTTQIGQHVFMLANVTTTNCNEVDFTNNVDTTHQDATASWDPNNKLVLPAGQGIEGNINGDEELTYTINFQNTGTAPAVNVVLRDMVDTELDLATFRMLGASHSYTMQFDGREAIWKFNAIMLPDSTTNEAESHGHVTFAIRPNAGLPDGAKLTNTADIYFDYNEAIATNGTVNTIDYKLSVDNLENKATITLMPNPFKDYTTIRIDGDNGTYELRVFDMLGQQVQREITTNNVFTIERGTLAAGMYLYEVVKENKVVGKGKMIAAE